MQIVLLDVSDGVLEWPIRGIKSRAFEPSRLRQEMDTTARSTNAILLSTPAFGFAAVRVHLSLASAFVVFSLRA